MFKTATGTACLTTINAITITQCKKDGTPGVTIELYTPLGVKSADTREALNDIMVESYGGFSGVTDYLRDEYDYDIPM